MSFFSPVNQARWARFRHNRRGYWSLWLFLILFLCSLGAELLANDRPLLVQYRGQEEHRDACPIEDPRQHIAAVGVGAEPVAG